MSTTNERERGVVPADDIDDAVLEGLRGFVKAEVVPRQQALSSTGRHRRYEESGLLRPVVLDAMREVRQASSRAGYYTMLAPKSVGGSGLGFSALFRIWEFIFKECGADLWLGYESIGHWIKGPSHLLAGASEVVRQEALPSLLDGSKTLCFAMSEPDAGSDVWRMRTRARQVDGGWRISGTKQWISNGPYAEWAFVFAVTDADALTQRRGGISAFFVPTAAMGFNVDSIIELFGHPGGDEAIISLNDVFVPDSHVLGEIGSGLGLAMSGVSSGRLYNSGRSVGLAQWALDKTIAYAEERETFGKPIIENQAISFPLADAAMEIHAARLIGLDCARLLDSGHDARYEVSMAKTYATEMAVRVIDRAMQVHGGMGFTNEVALAEAWQQVRRICVADGSSEILRRQMVKELRHRGRSGG